VDGAFEAYLRSIPSGATMRGKETYLTIDAALDAVDWVRNQHAIVLGIEGFWLSPTTVRPSMDHIADLHSSGVPWDVNVRDSTADARRLLQAWRSAIDAVVLVVQMRDR
jgi:hypothetical protein